MKKIAVIGGGLGGLISAILLNRRGFDITLYEEKKYPFHRVCGEYISNEVVPFLQKNHLYPDHLVPSSITSFVLTAPSGRRLETELDLGGFGVSRYAYDEWLYHIAIKEGVHFAHDRVIDVAFGDHSFSIKTRKDTVATYPLVIGAYGKRSTLDKTLKRAFFTQKSPYIGVKYHIETDQVSPHAIELHNFENGYCGVSKVEGNTYNLCYLSHRKNLQQMGSIPAMEEAVLGKNPYLKKIFKSADFLFDKPEVINEISFERKEIVHDHILMAGDAAGMITPLCGNGMAIAIHTAQILTEEIVRHWKNTLQRAPLEISYQQSWQSHFGNRLWAGRNIQRLFGSLVVSEGSVWLGQKVPAVVHTLMKKTHGQPF